MNEQTTHEGDAVESPKCAEGEDVDAVADAVAQAIREFAVHEQERKQSAEAVQSKFNFEFRATLRNLGRSIAGADDDAVLGAVARMYYSHDFISRSDLHELVSDAIPAQGKLPDAPSGFECIRCGCPLLVSSRDAMKKRRRAFKPYSKYTRYPNSRMCGGCIVAKNDELNAYDENKKATTECERKEKLERVAALRALPYADYLQSDHWWRVRDTLFKKAHYRCDLCNGPGPLNVHHKTYERIGCEHYEDLIVLCQPCHATFHGKLK